MTRVVTLWHAISYLFAVLSAVLIATLVVMIFADVSYRTLGGGSIPGTYQAAELVIAAAIFLGLPFAHYKEGMINVDLITSRMRPVLRQWTVVAGTIVTLCTCALLSWGMLESLDRAIQTNDGIVGLVTIPTWPARLTMLVGMIWFCGELVISLVRQWNGKDIEPHPVAELY